MVKEVLQSGTKTGNILGNFKEANTKHCLLNLIPGTTDGLWGVKKGKD